MRMNDVGKKERPSFKKQRMPYRPVGKESEIGNFDRPPRKYVTRFWGITGARQEWKKKKSRRELERKRPLPWFGRAHLQAKERRGKGDTSTAGQLLRRTRRILNWCERGRTQPKRPS